MSSIPTEASAPTAANVILGPDWLRSKPVAVFSKYRYGQEEMLGLWSFSQNCPQTISQIDELGASEPLRPVSMTQYTDEEKDSYQSRGGLSNMSSDRGRGRTSDRGRGRGGGVQRGTRRFDPNSRYYEKPDNRSADSDNWRRRDPDPVPDTDDNFAEQPPSYPPFPSKDAEQPPSYPPYPTKGFSPQIDNRETNSWKRTEPEAQIVDMEPPHSSPVAEPPKSVAMEPPTPPSVSTEASHFTVTQADSPETMLRNISKTLYRDISIENKPEPFNTPSLFSPFTDTQGSIASSGQAPGNISSHLPSTSPSIATPTAISTTAMDMPSLFNRESVSPQPYTTPPQPYSSPPQPFTSSQPFPSLSEIGNSLKSNVTDNFRGQGFLPPPQQPSVTTQQRGYVPIIPTPPPQLQPTMDKLQPYRSDELWFYLDPKGHTQGPFDSVKMFSWFREGYFGMDLEIRRATENNFTMLETMISKCGRIPFQPEDKTSPPPGAPQQHLPGMQHTTNTQPQLPTTNPQWTTVTSIWGNTNDTLVDSVTTSVPGNTHFLPSGFLTESTKAQRAEEMRKEIERAMAIEQQRKHQEMEEEKKRDDRLEKEQFLLAQRQMMEVKLAEEQHQKEEEMRRFREEEMKKNKLFEEETERIRLEKDRLERERIMQAEKVRIELEEAEKARHALAQERLKLERERQLVKQKEEELIQRAEADKRRLVEEARVAEERRAAQQAAAEAKAMAKAIEEANAAAIREARREAEIAKKQEDAWAKEIREQENRWQAPSPPDNKWGSSPPQNVWSAPVHQPGLESNPWAHIPQTNMTKASTRTPVPTTKGWGKPVQQSGAVPLSQIQQAEAEKKRSGGYNKPYGVPEPAVSRPTTWATQKQPAKTRSLADIQREEERRSVQQHNYTHAQQNDWNPVAGMFEEDQKPKKQAKAQQQKAQQKAQQQKAQPQKGQTKKSKAPAPLMDLFSNSEPKDEFTVWCESQVTSFKNQHIDVPTFISFLRDVESPREVREYVVSYLGDTLSTDRFIQEFISKRKTAKQSSDALSMGFQPVNNSRKGTTVAAAQQQPQPTSRKGKRKKMQKVNAASLLGINCTASSDARNRGDIDTVVTQ